MTDIAPGADAGQGGAAAAAAPTAADWISGLPEDARGYVTNKGWKAPADLLTSYQNLEKLRGVPAERLLTLPEKPDDPAWSQVYDRLGRPQAPDQYELATLQGADPAFAGEASKWFHEAGVPKQAAHALAGKFNEYLAKAEQANEEARAQQAEIEWGELKKEWGQGFDQHSELARRAAQQFGVDEETLQKMESIVGPKKLMQLWARIGEGLGEHKPEGIQGGQRQFAMTPESAKARIQALQADKAWATSYLNGDANAKAEMDRLMRLAYGT